MFVNRMEKFLFGLQNSFPGAYMIEGYFSDEIAFDNDAITM